METGGGGQFTAAKLATNHIKESKQVPGEAVLDGQYHTASWTTLY